MGKFIIWFCLIVIIAKTEAQNFNRPIPANYYPYQFIENNSISGYFLTCPIKLNVPPNDPNYYAPTPTLLDSNGFIVWYMANEATNIGDFKYFENEQLFGYIRTANGHASYQLLDLNLNLIDSFTNLNNVGADAHEFQILSNGNYVIGGIKDSIMNLVGYTFNGTPGSAATTVEAYVVQEFDPSHQLVFEWNSLDHIFPTEAYDIYGYNVNGFDYCHGNSIEEDTDGNLIISFRHLNAVYKIDHLTGNVIWILGGKSSDFTFPNDGGFSGQHDARRLPDGTISLYDNANSAPPPRKSRGVIYSLDTINWTATRTWQYIHTPAFFARAMGNHQINGSNKHIINYGWNYRPNPSVLVADHLGMIDAQINFADSVVSYRSYLNQIPFSFNQPEIICTNDGANIVLSAPSGFTEYLWSTGDTTASIIANQSDTFQVWVNYGAGYLGSTPFFYDQLLSNCAIGIEELANEIEVVQFIGYYDLLGREVEFPIAGQLYIARYSNGKNEIKYIPK
jgi:Arylsulfotransferase (ASST)